MRTEKLVVGGVTTALFVFAICYAVWRHAAVGSVDWAGVIVLGLGGAVCAAMERHLAVAGRSGNEPGVGRSHSGIDPAGCWPIAVAATATATGLVHQALWVIVPSVAAVVLTTGCLCSGGSVFRQPTGIHVR